MGGCTFGCTAEGKTAQEAFAAARAAERASMDYDEEGYNGSIVDKPSFVMITMPTGPEGETAAQFHLRALEFGRHLCDAMDPRIEDKYGPAGCIALPSGRFYFFGWASQ